MRYNATGGSYIIGHGGGAAMQHRFCTDIRWEDAQPGDLVFYPAPATDLPADCGSAPPYPR